MSVTAVKAEVRDNDLSFEVGHQEEAEHQRVKLAQLSAVDAGVDLETGLNRNAGLPLPQNTRRRTGEARRSSIIPSASSRASFDWVSNRKRSSCLECEKAPRNARRPFLTVNVFSPCDETV